MYDSMMFYGKRAELPPPNEGARLDAGYLLATVHRAENADSIDNLRQIFSAFGEISARYPIIVALHPRTRKFIEMYQMNIPSVQLLEHFPIWK